MRSAKRARLLFAVTVPLLTLAGAHPARAQLSGSLSVSSDQRWRGRTLSAGRPASTVAIGYDLPEGIYVDGSATAAWTRRDDVALISGTIDAGYAWRTADGLAIDIGATRQQFTRYASVGRDTGYTELYGGVSGRSVSARLSYSPDYFRANSHTLYLGIDGVVRPGTDWRLTAHAGAIAYLSPIKVIGLRTIEYDYGVGISRSFGPLEFQVNLTGGGPDPDYYGEQPHEKTALTAGLTFTF